ncbi:MAG TPA: DUF3025 domain-containing protein [Rhizomicrobium sp.]|nr:DUF3025 domain-containing protein [Rhizomicrobium sp.]
MRYVAPARGTVDPLVFDRSPLSAWHEHAALLEAAAWPSIDMLNSLRPTDLGQRFVAQTPALLADGLHYEQRIAEHGDIATREGNWHDLLNALIWLRYPALKQALNQRQISEIARMGPKQRSREQYALTHFDEGGVIVLVRDPALLALWDEHDWYGLFWRHRQAWLDGRIQAELFGHALLEQALTPEQLLVGKALVFQVDASQDMATVRTRCAELIASGQLLHDPLELRPLPLSGVPGWRDANTEEAFHRSTVCYQPRRAGRQYPPPIFC